MRNSVCWHFEQAKEFIALFETVAGSVAGASPYDYIRARPNQPSMHLKRTFSLRIGRNEAYSRIRNPMLYPTELPALKAQLLELQEFIRLLNSI